MKDLLLKKSCFQFVKIKVIVVKKHLAFTLCTKQCFEIFNLHVQFQHFAISANHFRRTLICVLSPSGKPLFSILNKSGVKHMSWNKTVVNLPRRLIFSWPADTVFLAQLLELDTGVAAGLYLKHGMWFKQHQAKGQICCYTTLWSSEVPGSRNMGDGWNSQEFSRQENIFEVSQYNHMPDGSQVITSGTISISVRFAETTEKSFLNTR